MLSLPPSSQNYFIHLGLNLARSDNTDLGKNHLPIAIDYQQCGHGSHTKARRGLSAHLTHQVEPNHGGLAIQLSLQPVHDRFCQQARASKVGVKLNHGRLTGGQDPV